MLGVSLYDISIGLCNCSDSVVFLFSVLLQDKTDGKKSADSFSMTQYDKQLFFIQMGSLLKTQLVKTILISSFGDEKNVSW